MNLRTAPFALVLALFTPACDGVLEQGTDTPDGLAGDAGALVLAAPPVAPGSGRPSLTPRPTAPEAPRVVAHFLGRTTTSPTALDPSNPADPPAPTSHDEALAAVSTLLGAALVDVAPAALGASLPTLVPHRRFFLHDGALVVSSLDSATDFAAGPALPLAAPGPDAFAARRLLALDALPAADRLLPGHTVRVYSHEREVCVATIGPLSLEAHLVHGPTGYELYDEDGNPIPEAPIAHDPDEVFELGARLVKAALTPLFGDCAGAAWAELDRPARPVLYREARAPGQRLARQAIAAFHRSDLYRAIQKRFLENYDASLVPVGAHWDTIDGARPNVDRLLGDDGDELLVVHADTLEGCGGIGDQGLAVFRRDPATGALTFVTGAPGFTKPAAWVDLDRDGSPEAIDGADTYRALYRFSGAVGDDAYDVLETLSVPDLTDFGCGC